MRHWVSVHSTASDNGKNHHWTDKILGGGAVTSSSRLLHLKFAQKMLRQGNRIKDEMNGRRRVIFNSTLAGK